MTKAIEANPKLISEYLKKGKLENFVIPDYQRGYSWGIIQCDKLWEDIEAFIATEASESYFFGTIIIDCSDANKYSLIDGQQRTTTFLYILKALLIHLNNRIRNIPNDRDSIGLKAGLEKRRNIIMSILYKAEVEEIPYMLLDSTQTLGILILENMSINELHRDEIKTIIEAIDFETCEHKVHIIPRKRNDNRYTNHFRNFKFFYEKLGEKSDSKINQFAKVFLEKCQVIEILSWETDQAITMFNSLNSSGLSLADANIISAKLSHNSGTERSKFNEKWKSIIESANDLKNRKIDIDAVLQQFMYINRAQKKEYVNIKEDGKVSVDVTTPGLRRYYTDTDEYGIKSPRKLLSEPLVLCDNLFKITELWTKIKDYPIVKLLLKCNENAKLYLSSYLYRFETVDITEEMVGEICECLLRLFTVLELVDSGYSSSKFKTFLFGENIKFVDNTNSIDDIKNDFNEHINKNWTKPIISATLFESEKNLLVYINEYLYAKSKSLKFDFAENVNIEHIMPASGRNNVIIREAAGIMDDIEFYTLVNKLGNKILLEEDINKSIGNEWFITKKQNINTNIRSYKDSRYNIAVALTKYHKDTWTKEDIDLATNKAVDRIVKFIFNESETK